jgi:hypothetical protein
MALLSIGLAVPDLEVPRGDPCGAISGLNIVCGATPSALYIRSCCVTESHDHEIWLCPIHAAIVACGGGICKMCALNGGVIPVRIYRLSSPLRIHGNGGVIRAK